MALPLHHYTAQHTAKQQGNHRISFMPAFGSNCRVSRLTLPIRGLPGVTHAKQRVVTQCNRGPPNCVRLDCIGCYFQLLPLLVVKTFVLSPSSGQQWHEFGTGLYQRTALLTVATFIAFLAALGRCSCSSSESCCVFTRPDPRRRCVEFMSHQGQYRLQCSRRCRFQA